MLALSGHPFSSYTWKALSPLDANGTAFEHRVVGTEPEHAEFVQGLESLLPSFKRSLSGSACVLTLPLTGGYAAWAAQPSDEAAAHLPAGSIHVKAVLRIDGGEPRLACSVASPA